MMHASRTLLPLALVLLLDAAPARAAGSTDSSEPAAPHGARQTKHAREPKRTLDRGFVQLEDGEGYRLLNPERGWCIPRAREQLQVALAAHHTRYPETEVVIGDLSKKNGGRLLPHLSHRSGRDVDLRVPLKVRTKYLVEASARTIDLERTWHLITTLIAGGEVQYVFLNWRLQRPLYKYAREQGVSEEELTRLFQFPHRRALTGIIRHEPGHLGHFHVRFRRLPPTPAPASLVASSS